MRLTPAWFIYRAYPAAERQAYKDKPFMSKPNREEAYVSSAVGSSLSQSSFGGSEVRSRIGPAHGGGIRGRVSGFSGSSRRNLLRRMASINHTAFRSYQGRVFSVTLTYPGEYPEDSEPCKRHLEALRKRIQRRFGEFSGFWRLSIQQRGAWHFHLLLFVPPSFGSLKELRHFVASSWYEICGRDSEGHLLAGTRVEEVRSWRRATSYAERYVAKREEFPEGTETGRVWGAWNGEMLPVRWETVRVSLRDAYRIRRVYRRLALGGCAPVGPGGGCRGTRSPAGGGGYRRSRRAVLLAGRATTLPRGAVPADSTVTHPGGTPGTPAA